MDQVPSPVTPADRGVLYIVWGDRVDRHLQRSIQSVRRRHPRLPVHVERVTVRDPARSLAEKSRMGSLTPFRSTLYLDVDTVVLGALDFGFEQAEQFGIACAICECPWLRRYGQPGEEDATEYNTGVLFFTSAAAPVFAAWEALAAITPSTSRWTTTDNRPRGLTYDDQAGFARAVRQCRFNPCVLPLNYNLRPSFVQGAFAPVKVWHDYADPPQGLAELSLACERGERPVTYFALSPQQPPPRTS